MTMRLQMTDLQQYQCIKASKQLISWSKHGIPVAKIAANKTSASFAYN